MSGELAVHRRQARRRAVDIVLGGGDNLQRAARADSLVSGLDAAFVNNLNARQLAGLAELALDVLDSEKKYQIKVEARGADGFTMVTFVAPDKQALLSDVAGVLAAHHVYVDTAILATVETSNGPLALDLFYVRDPQGEQIAEDDGRWQRVQESLEVWSTADSPHEFVQNLLKERRSTSTLKPRLTSSVQTTVQVHNDASEKFAVIEVFTEDRPGLLHLITRVLARHDLDIHQAMVNTEGERASDAFYVRHQGLGQLSEVQTKTLVADLETTLSVEKGEI
jgi:[protein-PII] uridylyltransferase